MTTSGAENHLGVVARKVVEVMPIDVVFLDDRALDLQLVQVACEILNRGPWGSLGAELTNQQVPRERNDWNSCAWAPLLSGTTFVA